MTNRERVAAAFAHRQPDRTPVSLGTTIVDGMTRFALKHYEEYLGREVTRPLVTSRIMQTAGLPEWLWEQLGMEFRPVRHVNSLTPDTTYLEDGSYIDCFGITWQKSEMYFDPVKGPWFGELTESAGPQAALGRPAPCCRLLRGGGTPGGVPSARRRRGTWSSPT